MDGPESPVPAASPEGARDLQSGLTRFARGGLVLAAVLALASAATHAVTGGDASERGNLLHELAHFGTLLIALPVFLIARGKARSHRELEALEAGLTLGMCWLFALLGFTAPTSLSAAFSVALALTYVLIWRSILIPSTFQRTLAVSAIAAAPVVYYFATQSVSSSLGQSEESSRLFSVFGCLWSLFAVLVASVNSRQLFGLREQLREAGKLGQYTLEERIGQGGMGVVYRAAHALLRRPAAIKLLSNERTSDRDQARFEREVQLTSRLAHPNTIAIFDYGRTADGVFYYVMEYLDGLDLDRLVKQEGPLPPARAVHILTQICGALSEAHALGLVHRDVKPANVVLTDRVDEPDIVKVVDFGLARALTPNPEESQHGAITGTPLYLAPEAISAPATADSRADIYAVGAVAYYLLSGRNVFEAPSVIETLGQHMLKEPTAPSAHLTAPLAGDLEALVLSCLSKDPAKRPQSTADLRAALLACEDGARYDRAAALAWWRNFRAAPAHTVEARDGSSVTMAVDLGTRQQTRRTA